MGEVVEIRVVRNRVAEIDADGLVDSRRAVIAFGHKVLDFLESLRQPHLGRQVEAGRRQQLVDRLLRKVERAHAAVTGPFVNRGDGIVVDRRKSQFVEPARDAAPAIHEPGRFTGSHGET